jgi:membrane-associated PAP2 superfamily phosphatase
VTNRGAAGSRSNRAALRLTIPIVTFVLLPLLAFGGLGEDVAEGDAIRGDFLTHALMLDRVHPLRWFLAAWSVVGGGRGLLLLTAIAIGWLVLDRRKADALFVGLSVVGSTVLSQAFKAIFGRPRPPVTHYLFSTDASIALLAVVALAALVAWRTRWRRLASISAAAFAILVSLDWLTAALFHVPPELGSFPSGHAVSSMAFAASLVVVWPRRERGAVAVAAAVFVFLVGVSRVYLGFHYPSDVAGGWCLSIAWVTVLTAVVRPRLPAVIRRMEPSPVAG